MASFEETLPQPVEDFMLIGSFGEVIVTPQSDIPEKDRPSQLFMHYFAQMPTRKKTSKRKQTPGCRQNTRAATGKAC